MAGTLRPPRVLSTTEAREAAPELARRYREQGIEGEIVFFGAQRRPDAAIVPAALLDALAPFLDDLLTAVRVRQRLADDDGTRLTLSEILERNSWSEDEIAKEAAIIREELGLG